MGVLLPSTTGALITSAIGMAMSLIPYKKNLYDLSTQNTTVMLTAKCNGSLVKSIPLVRQFADDRDAIEISPMEFNDTSTSYNGRLIAVAKVPKVRVTLSVIPHSPNDIDLADVAKWAVYNKTELGNRLRSEITLTITQPRIDEQAASFQLIGVGGATQKLAMATFSNGVLVSSSAIGTEAGTNIKHGAETTSSREGRHVASQYIFEFVDTDMC
jgi:hypothetical protein